MEAIQPNAVITANSFNVLVFRESWLIRERIVADGEIIPGAIFTPAIVQFATTDCEVLVIPDRLQVVPKESCTDQVRAVSGIMLRIAETIPHTPFSGVGLNFGWHTDPVVDVPARSRSIFLNTSGPYAQHFEVADSRFGGYFSKDFHSFRLKLTVLPVRHKGHDALQTMVNLHADLNDEGSIERIREILGVWNEAKEYAAELAAGME